MQENVVQSDCLCRSKLVSVVVVFDEEKACSHKVRSFISTSLAQFTVWY